MRGLGQGRKGFGRKRLWSNIQGDDQSRGAILDLASGTRRTTGLEGYWDAWLEGRVSGLCRRRLDRHATA